MSAQADAGPGPRAASPPVTGPRRELSGLLAIAQRDVTKLLRDRPRLAVNLAFPSCSSTAWALSCSRLWGGSPA